ncbi:MAG: hypothetical protein ACJZ1Y_06005 [Candidatus Neomarinimicrobiota bacterium]
MKRNFLYHIFSPKSIKIRATTFIWVLFCSWFWTGDPMKSASLSISVLFGSMIIQGFYEWSHDN